MARSINLWGNDFYFYRKWRDLIVNDFWVGRKSYVMETNNPGNITLKFIGLGSPPSPEPMFETVFHEVSGEYDNPKKVDITKEQYGYTTPKICTEYDNFWDVFDEKD